MSLLAEVKTLTDQRRVRDSQDIVIDLLKRSEVIGVLLSYERGRVKVSCNHDFDSDLMSPVIIDLDSETFCSLDSVSYLEESRSYL
jgi:hypothetical protein